jgi:hypothetical protein
MNRRAAMFQCCDADREHQRLAGIASWAAFSARWRARQGLPLLHPMDVQYLTPQDFCDGCGQPLPPTVQRRLFRQYVQAALRVGQRRLGLASGDLAFVPAAGCVWSGQFHPDFLYGRDDLGPYETRTLSPVRPYGVPVAPGCSDASCQCYWLDGSAEDDDDNGDESWIDEMS